LLERRRISKGDNHAKPSWPTESTSWSPKSSSWPAASAGASESAARPASESAETSASSSRGMTDQLWWNRWPEVLEREKTALQAERISFTEDGPALANGVMQLNLVLPSEMGGHKLQVVYPDYYPYFRFQVYAPDLTLSHHQNPFEKNLCLIGRRTHWWNTTDTAGGLLRDQFKRVVETGNATDIQAVLGEEEEQAEPFSDHYPFAPSMILIDGGWTIPKVHQRGHLVVGVFPPQSREKPPALIRGAVLEVLSETGDVICSASEAIRRTFSSGPFYGRWARVKAPITEGNHGLFIKALNEQHPNLSPRFNHVQWESGEERWLRFCGVLFPEETAHRKEGEGWVFVCSVERKLPKGGNPPLPFRKKIHQ
jgi:hypothetical protein